MQKIFVNSEGSLVDVDLAIVFGYGVQGQMTHDVIKRDHPEVKVIFCDDNSAKWNKKELNIISDGDVLSLEEALSESRSPKCFFVIGSKIYRYVMSNKLLEKGVPKVKICEYESDCLRESMADAEFARKTTPLKKIHFEMDLAAHCNLNCKYCSTFSPIAQEEFYDLDEFDRDVKRMSFLFSGEAEYIQLIGGEPLLNKNICRYMEILREGFPNVCLKIFTNGILLFSMNDEFWDTCKRLNFQILVTRYPNDIDYDRMKKEVEDRGISFFYVYGYEDGRDFTKYKMYKLAVDPEGKQNILDSYRRCAEPNECIKLRKGKLFTCVRAAVAYRFNRRFGTDMQISDADYIDIYNVVSKEDIFNGLASGPIPFCRYCDMRGRGVAYDWDRSSGEINEWIFS